MSSRVMHALLSRGLLGNDTVVTARIGQRNRMGRIEYGTGDYMVIGVRAMQSSWDLELRSVIGHRVVSTDDSCIIAIDGMSIDRYADVYNINSDGSDKRIGKKRGRKPKNTSQ